jgi:hypothetical protein
MLTKLVEKAKKLASENKVAVGTAVCAALGCLLVLLQSC